MTVSERADFNALFARFAKHEAAWNDGTAALLEIRDRRLFREEFKTFEEFCRKKLGMTKTNANRRIQTGEVAQDLATIVVKPERESHVRPLLQLTNRDERIGAFQEAVNQAKRDNKPLSAQHVSQAVQKRLPKDKSQPDVLDQKKAALIANIKRNIVLVIERMSLEQLTKLDSHVQYAEANGYAIAIMMMGSPVNWPRKVKAMKPPPVPPPVLSPSGNPQSRSKGYRQKSTTAKRCRPS